MRFALKLVAILASLAELASALGQKQIITFDDGKGDTLRLAGERAKNGQILVHEDDYWGVIRAAGDLATDFGRVTGTNLSLSNGKKNANPATFRYDPIDTSNNTVYRTRASKSLQGPSYADPDVGSTVIVAGTIGHSKYIDDMIHAGKIDVSAIKGRWESFVTVVVKDPVPGCHEALVIAGSMPRGTIYGLYDISEQIGVSPWYFWADVPTRKNTDIFVTREQKIQGPPSVKYRGLFLNDEQPGLSDWIATNFDDNWNGSAGYNHHFYALVCELLLRLRANYLWPTVWGSIVYTDDPANQPMIFAYEVVLGSSHTEPMMRAQNEFGTYYPEYEWAYNVDNKTIDEYFRYGVQRARPYARNSLWTMAMRGTGDTAIEGLGVDVIIKMLETLVHNQQDILEEGLGVDSLADVPQLWCLYKEVQSYKSEGLEVPSDITLLWADDNWGNIRRMPLKNETERRGGAGVYYHFDFVGDPRDYKWINTIQLEKTVEQMQMAYARRADRIWIVNVGDLKPLEIPISHFLDIAYDADRWDIESTQDWVKAWVGREFGSEHGEKISSIITRYGMYSARRKFELIEANTYSVINYNEAAAVLAQWMALEKDAEAVYDVLEGNQRAAFFQMIMHPVQGGRIVHEIYITAAKNNLYAWQKRNTANAMIDRARSLLYHDANLTAQWDKLLDGKWAHFMDQTHLGYDGYWQQPMRNTLPQMTYVQETVVSLGGQVRIGVEASNASLSGDDQFHTNSGSTLELPPLDPYGPSTRYFDIFSAGTEHCVWNVAPWEPWVKLSKTSGAVGPDGLDQRVYVSVDWDRAPAAPNVTLVNINVTSPCRKYEKYGYREPMVVLPVVSRSLPENFTNGFVESDGHVAIEGPHYQSISNPGASGSTSNVTYHTFTNYGRTMGGVGLMPLDLDKQTIGTTPALEYNMYLFSNFTVANVTLYLSPSHNYLGDRNPLEYAIALFPSGDDQVVEPTMMRPVGPSVGASLPDGWGNAVADAVWGANTNTSTTSFNVSAEGAYTLRIWCLLPGIIVQKVIIDLGGVRDSYLGPPESFLVGRDKIGEYDQKSFLDAPGTLGAKAARPMVDEMSSNGGIDETNDHGSGQGSDDEEDAGSTYRPRMCGILLTVAAAAATLLA